MEFGAITHRKDSRTSQLIALPYTNARADTEGIGIPRCEEVLAGEVVWGWVARRATVFGAPRDSGRRKRNCGDEKGIVSSWQAGMGLEV